MQLNKVFIECRYENNLLFNDMEKLSSIYRNNSDVFDIQNFDRNNNIFQLSSQKDKINASVTVDRMTFDMDMPISIENFKNKTTKYCESVNNILNLEGYTRIGIRAFWGVEVDSMEEAVNTIQSKFFKVIPDQKGFMGKKITMNRVGFSTIDNGFKLNINISPNQINIVEITNGETTKNINRKEISIDIDIYQDEYIVTKNIYSAIKSMVEMNKVKATEVTKYIKG